MATLILGVIGGVVGGIAAPGLAFSIAGAMLGWSIGTTVGSYIDSSRQHYFTADMGRVSDLRITVASYGTSIPQCWGKVRIPGIIIWGTDLVEHEQDINSGGGGKSFGGGPTVTTRNYTYTLSCALALCRGNRIGSGHIKIFADDIVILDNLTTPGTPTSQYGTVTHAAIFDGLSNQVGDSWTLSDGSHVRLYYGTETQLADPLIITSASNTVLPAGSDNPAFRGTCYIVFENFAVTNFGNRLPNFSVEIDTGASMLDEVLSDMMAQVDIDPSTEMDLSLLSTTQVTGIVMASRTDVKSAIQPLLDAYSFDLVDVDGKVKGIPRGGAPVATLTWANDDLGVQTVDSGTAPPIQRVVKSRAEDVTLPKRIDVGYYSTSIDMQQATQGAIRQSARCNNYITQSYPLTLGDNEARQMAERLMYLQWVERDTYAAQVSPRWTKLCCADVIMLQTDSSGTLRRVRIVEMECAPRGEMRCKFVADDDGVITQTTTGTTPTGGTTNGTPIATDFFAWSGKELRDTDGTNAGVYVAATGAVGWQGCTVMMSTDGGVTYDPIGTISARSIFGVASTALGSTYTPNGNGFDATETFNVATNNALSTTSENSVLTGQGNYGLLTQADQSVSNAANYEIMGWATATLVTTNHYTVSDMLRSQRSTLATGHTNTDVFVNLTQALGRFAVASTLVGTVVKIKCVSPYIDPTTVTEQDVLIAAPTAPYATTGGAGALADAARTPVWRVRGYLAEGNTISSALDDSYFPDATGTPGTNQPGTVNPFYWEEASLSPIDMCWRYSTPGVLDTLYLRMNLKNTTGSTITFDWYVGIWDDLLKIRVGGSVIYSSGAWDTTGTVSVTAGSTVLVEIFYRNGYNGGNANFDPSNNPGTAMFATNALKKGLTWLDAGK
jgi:hypothetical protein